MKKDSSPTLSSFLLRYVYYELSAIWSFGALHDLPVNKQDIVLQVESPHTNAQIQSLTQHVLVHGLLQLSDTV